MKNSQRIGLLALCLALIFLAACDQLEGLAPQILTFTANPTTIDVGQESTLSWSILGGAEDLEVILTPGDVALGKSGSYNVSPSETTTYMLSAGTTTKEITVTLTGSPPQPTKYSQVARLSASDGEDNDGFGADLAVSGTSLIVGAPEKIIGPGSETGFPQVFPPVGGAYFFKPSNDTWQEVSKTDGGNFDLERFAFSVDTAGSYALIGGLCCNARPAWGETFIYERIGDAWQFADNLSSLFTKSDISPTNAVLSGNHIVARGEIGTRGAIFDTGPLFVLELQNDVWVETAPLELDGFVEGENAPQDSNYIGFGSALDIDENYVIASGPNALPNSVFIFENNGDTWSDAIRLEPRQPDTLTNFGAGVAISGNTALVSGNIDGLFFEDKDVVFAFERTDAGWEQTNIFTSEFGDNYSNEFVISANTLVLSATDTIGSGLDLVDIYTKADDGWSKTQTLQSPKDVSSDDFGAAVAIYGDTIFVGSPGDSEEGESVGAVYVYQK